MKAKDKEPILSAREWFDNKRISLNPSDEKLIKAYAKYHTEWHLNNVKEVVCEEAKCEVDEISIISVSEQSITNAVDKYIEDRL